MSTILIKRSQVTATPLSLAEGELAFSELSNTLFIGVASSAVVAVGGAGLFAKLASPTFTGSVNAPTPTTADNSTLVATTAFVKAQAYATLAGPTFTGSVNAPTPTSGDNSTLVATTAFVKAQSYLTANQTITCSGDASGSGTTAITLTLPNVATAGTKCKVTYNAKGLVTSGADLAAGDIPTITASKVSDFDTQVRASRLDQMATPSGSVSMNSQKITSLAAPSTATDAANKSYVDSVASGLDIKPSVRAATTANITLSGTQTIDGVAVIAADRVLVKNQSTGSQNGIYVASASAWARAADFVDSTTATAGAFVFVEEGTTLGGTGWVVTTTGVITVGTTAVTWTQFGAGAIYTNGNGLSLTGTVFAAVGTTNRISVSGSGIDISAAYVGQTSITTLGTVTTGTIDGGTF